MFKNISCILILLISIFSLKAQDPFNSVYVEEIPIPAAAQAEINTTTPGAQCYRVYICMDEPWWELVSVFGYQTAGNPYPGYINLQDPTTTRFFQSPFGTILASGVNLIQASIVPSIPYDSFFTMNALHSGEGGNLAFVADVGVGPNFEAGGNLDLTSDVGGSWFYPVNRAPTFLDPPFNTMPIPGTWNTDPTNMPQTANRILIAQLTTNGIFEAQLSFQFKQLNPDYSAVQPSINVFEYTYQFDNISPVDGTFDDPCFNFFLPVELLSFDAEVKGEKVRLKWITESEQDNDYFTIERSSNARDWEAIGTIDGAGTVSTTRHYFSYDNNPLQGTSYYRLRQTDLNGYSEVTDIVSVSFRSKENILLFPNPSKEAVIKISGNTGSLRQVRLLSEKGEVIQSMQNNNEGPVQELNFGGSGLEGGLYLVEFEYADGSIVTKRWVYIP